MQDSDYIWILFSKKRVCCLSILFLFMNTEYEQNEQK